MDKSGGSMIANLKVNTGKTLDEWLILLSSKPFKKHGEFISFLKQEHGLTHGFANLITHKARKSDAGSVENKEDLVALQYRNKEHFLPFYQQLVSHIEKFGADVEIAPKKAYVSLRSKKQFACLKPATKSRFEIGLNLKGSYSHPLLNEVKKASSMFSHQVNISDIGQIDEELINLIQVAYRESK